MRDHVAQNRIRARREACELWSLHVGKELWKKYTVLVT